jgi:microcystin-dependent protein
MAIDFPNSPTNGQEFTSGGTTWVYDGTKWNAKTVAAYSNDAAPVGTIVNFAGTVGSIPAGWLACDGAAISRTTYATLFSTIGTTYGAGNGSTTFNTPDIESTSGVFIIRWTTTLGVTATDSLYATPVGVMMTWPTTSSYPTGWLRADGSAVSRTSYADLFALIGTTYGTGNGSTTFNLPNLVETGGPVTLIKAVLSGGQEPSTIAHAARHIRGGADIIDGDRVQVDYVPANYTRNSAASGAGANTDLTAHLGGIDQLFGPWSSWTTYTIGGFTTGNATKEGKYLQMGKVVAFWTRTTLGSTSAVTGQLTISVPVAASTSHNGVFKGHFFDSGTGFPLMQPWFDGAVVNLYAVGSAAAYASAAATSSAVPMTWATGDAFYCSGIYEAA